MLLLHAFPLHSAMFERQIEALSSKYRFILPDHRGFGDSAAGAGPTEMSRLARDALAILSSLQIARAVIGGVSMGGYATMALLRENPERAKAIVLIDTQLGADDTAGRVRREELATTVEARGMSVLVESMIPKLLDPSSDIEIRNLVEHMIRSNHPAGCAAALRGMAKRSDSRDVLARYSGPALVIVGERDSITPLDKARQIADSLPNAELVRIPGAGHLSNLENPHAFNAVLEAFLEKVSRA